MDVEHEAVSPAARESAPAAGNNWLKAVLVCLGGWSIIAAMVGAVVGAGYLDETTSVDAEAVADLEPACRGKAVENAAEFDRSAKPYQVAAFRLESGADEYDEQHFGSSRDFASTDESEVNVLACLKPVASTAATVKECRISRDGEQAQVPLQTVQYAVTYRSVATGEKVGTGSGLVRSEEDDDCARWESALTDIEGPVIYLEADSASLEAQIAKFAK